MPIARVRPAATTRQGVAVERARQRLTRPFTSGQLATRWRTCDDRVRAVNGQRVFAADLGVCLAGTCSIAGTVCCVNTQCCSTSCVAGSCAAEDLLTTDRNRDRLLSSLTDIQGAGDRCAYWKTLRQAGQPILHGPVGDYLRLAGRQREVPGQPRGQTQFWAYDAEATAL